MNVECLMRHRQPLSGFFTEFASMMKDTPEMFVFSDHIDPMLSIFSTHQHFPTLFWAVVLHSQSAGTTSSEAQHDFCLPLVQVGKHTKPNARIQ